MRLVWFSEIQWGWARTRKQQILRRLPPHWDTLFLSPLALGRRNNLLPSRDGHVTFACVPLLKNFPQPSLRRLFSRASVRRAWDRLVRAWVDVVIRRTGFVSPDRVCIVSNIYAAFVLEGMPRCALIYDCNDDHLAFPHTPPWASRYFERLVSEADAGIAVSQALARKLHDVGLGRVYVLSNGVDNELLVRAAEGPPPPDIRAMGHPLIGYAGAIAPWFDFELLDTLASSLPHATIVLVGPVFRDVEARLRRLLSSRANVRYLGLKPHDELGAYLAAMDVCLIPLALNPLMAAANPNKLYEYAALGKPIVTMRHSPELDELAGLISLASTREEFVALAVRALQVPPPREALVAFARANDWQLKAQRFAEIVSEVAGVPPPPQPSHAAGGPAPGGR